LIDTIGGCDSIAPAFYLLLELADDILPVDQSDVLRAAEVVWAPRNLSARDALHIAIMLRHGIDEILTIKTVAIWPVLG
jgi:predicted nucleic acid-binding protein